MNKLADAIDRAVSVGKLQSPAFSDEALALKFAERHGDDLRYVVEWNQWIEWDGTRWAQDRTLKTFSRSRDICRSAASECNEKATAKKIASAGKVYATERLARSDQTLAATTDQWDRENFLLNTPNGTVDLTTGLLNEHRRQDYLTKMTAVGPQEGCPNWHKFLDRTFDGNIDSQKFIQRVVGYALTGDVSEQAMFCCWGTSANGKSVFTNTVSGVLGDYHRSGSMNSFVATHHDTHPTDLAGLGGARLVTVVETEEGRRLAESKIKAVTGGDKIAVRFMRGDFFELTPQFKILMSGNHKPGLRNVDEAMRRRLHLVPFTVTIPPGERDNRLTDKLKAEWPGILHWAIQGCLQWQKFGLMPPATVRKATEYYLQSEDALRIWIDECCQVDDPNLFTGGATLYTSWKAWAERSGEFCGTLKSFTQKLEDRRFKRHRKRDARGLIGIAVK